MGTALASPDNLAIDHDGNIYIIEDRNGGVDNDIWFARDLNRDGDLNDPGEGIGRWASNGTLGSEFTGLYFDPRNKRRAWVNIQHPAVAMTGQSKSRFRTTMTTMMTTTMTTMMTMMTEAHRGRS